MEKSEALAKVASSALPKRKALGELGVPRSAYYRWLRRSEQRGLENGAGGGRPPWNRMTSREVDHVLSAAREMPELSPRQLASWVTDNMGFSVSESTVYRILRREGLVKRPEMRPAAGKEYHRKTTGPHQMWATDASYFRVVGWGYYYLVTVMDDYSRFLHNLNEGIGCHATQLLSGHCSSRRWAWWAASRTSRQITRKALRRSVRVRPEPRRPGWDYRSPILTTEVPAIELRVVGMTCL